MRVAPHAAFERGYVVARPSVGELGAHSGQSRDQFLERRVIVETVGVGAELSEHALRFDRPVDDQLACFGRGEHDPEQVAVSRGQAFDRREQQRLRTVPREELPSRTEHIRRRWRHGLDQAHELIGCAIGLGRRHRFGPIGQGEKVRVLRWCELQRSGDGEKDFTRGTDGSALFEPRVPTHRHTREQRHLLAAQSRGAPSSRRRQADRLGPE